MTAENMERKTPESQLWTPFMIEKKKKKKKKKKKSPYSREGVAGVGDEHKSLTNGSISNHNTLDGSGDAHHIKTAQNNILITLDQTIFKFVDHKN